MIIVPELELPVDERSADDNRTEPEPAPELSAAARSHVESHFWWDARHAL